MSAKNKNKNFFKKEQRNRLVTLLFFCFFTEKRILFSLLFRKSSFFNHELFCQKNLFFTAVFVFCLWIFTFPRTFSRIAFPNLKTSVVFSDLYYCLPKKNRLKRGHKDKATLQKALRLDKRLVYSFIPEEGKSKKSTFQHLHKKQIFLCQK